MTEVKHRRPAGTAHDPVRSVRVPDALWEAARERAAIEGTNMSRVLQTLIEGYAQGHLDLPTTIVVWKNPYGESADAI